MKKRWYGIPVVSLVAILLGLLLVTGGVFAAYSFNSFTTAITVDEPLTVEYNLLGEYGGDWDWHPLGDTDSLTIDGSAGDVFNIDLRINNRASSSLMVSTVITGWGVDEDYFTFTGFPNGTIPASDGNDAVPEWRGTTTITINGDAPVGTYNVNFTFTRE